MVVIDEHGVIIDVIDPQSALMENTEDSRLTQDLEYYKGIICPGFVNTHCHLELSHLKGKIKEQQGMAAFIKDIISQPSIDKNEINAAIADAEKQMLNNGIVAVGDISNNDSTFNKKKEGKMKYHTFVEIFDINRDANLVFENGIKLGKLLSQEGLAFSVAPHAPYTVSVELFRKINEYAGNEIVTIHNQESKAENDFFINRTGSIAEMFSKMGIAPDSFIPGGFNSVRSTLSHFAKDKKILLVHNTYTSKEDIQWAQAYNKNICWCFCPNANIYIENKLPDFNSFIDEKARITIGTDSLASNHSLSILEELKTISKHAAQIPLETLLCWATKNGAEFLSLDKDIGTIEKGKKPGLNLIQNIDLNLLSLTETSSVIRLDIPMEKCDSILNH